MSENWASIAGEVEAALVSIGDVSQPNGYPVTFRRGGTGSGSNWAPNVGNPTYAVAKALVNTKEMQDADGTLIGQSMRMVTISGASGFIPSDNDQIVLGQDLVYVDAATDASVAWQNIQSVKELAPAGVAVLYEITLAS